MNKHFKIFVLLLIPLALTGCTLKNNDAPSASNNATPTAGAGTASGDTVSVGVLDPAVLAPEFQALYDATSQKAKTWKADAQLVHYSIKLPFNFAVDQATEVFTFGSSTDAYNWWTLTYSHKTKKSVRALIPKEDYLGSGYSPVPTQFWKIQYIDAIQLAESHGGEQFRRDHVQGDVTISLAVGQPKNYLWWTSEYRSATSEPYRILVNPADKTVYSESGEQLSPASNAAPVATSTPLSTTSQTPLTSVTPSSAVSTQTLED